MERSEFLSKLGLSMAAICAGCSLVACSSKNGDSMPPSYGSIDLFSFDLGTQLLKDGDSVSMDDIIVVRLNSGHYADSFTAVQATCTHADYLINYDIPLKIFVCGLHNSEFSATGKVLKGPAVVPLKEYKVIVDGSNLTVKSELVVSA